MAGMQGSSRELPCEVKPWEKYCEEHDKPYNDGFTCNLSVHFGLSVLQPIKLKQHKLGMFEDMRNECGVST